MLDESHPCSGGPFSRDDREGGGGNGVPRLRLVTAASGGSGNPPARHYDLAARSIAARIRRKCRRWKRGTQTQNRHGGAPKGARPASWDAGTPAGVPDPQRHCGSTGCRCTRAPVGAPPTPHRGGEIRKDPGANTPREREVLFDVPSEIRDPENPVRQVAVHQAL